MRQVPLTRDAANEFVARYHRHSNPVVGHRFAIGVMVGDELVGVGIVGRPKSRCYDPQLVAEITRVCVSPDAPRNTCSFLYGVCRRVWQTMGGNRIITYTLQSEGGSSLRGAGFEIEAAIPGRNRRGWENREGRQRQEIQTVDKWRWQSVSY